MKLRATVLRGPLALVDAVRIGMQALRIALYHSTGVVVTAQQVATTFVPVLVAVFAVFVVGPGSLAAFARGIGADVAEAASRALALLLYLAAVARSTATRRLFAYHGAEHKAIAAFERHGRVPTPDEVRVESPIHVRCGTDFITLFVIAAGVLYAFVPRTPLWVGAALRIALVGVVAAVAYEVMRFAATRHSSPLGRALTWPGRALQRITTREPEIDQMEVALVALTAAVGD